MIIADTGFLYAIANRADKYHKNAVELISQLTEGLVTTWPVVTETSHLLLQRMGTLAHAKFIDNIFEGSIKIQNLPDDSIEQIPKLIKKYSDFSFFKLCNHSHIPFIFYRLFHSKTFNIMLGCCYVPQNYLILGFTNHNFFKTY